ncbi:YIP1 family protein [Streptomyces sp. NBC_01426]|uniref:Yip1 family protein n=1 Tax=Streptomyces sp. NBC_01426 TaxID=2975866 RepID=UPI002E342207|nr:Yip1 family protein [Streptomyces sp. NBC_01426]
MDDIDRNGSRPAEHAGHDGHAENSGSAERDKPDEHDQHDQPDRRDEPDERRSPVLSALLWSLVTAACLFGAGYAAFRWASTGMPLSPQPGSPWAYLATWSAFCFVGCLLLRWAAVTEGGEGTGYVVLVVAFAGVRQSLAHRPDLDLLWAWAVPALLLGTAAALAWRRRSAHRA